jgi:hypothetical protein
MVINHQTPIDPLESLDGTFLYWEAGITKISFVPPQKL